MPEQDPYAAIAKPIQGADPYAPIAKNDSTSAPPEKPGFLKSLGDSLGIQNPIDRFREHPVDAALSLIPAYAGPKALIGGAIGEGKRIGGELKQAYQGVKERNPYAVAAHSIQAIPLIGGAIDRGTQQMNPTHSVGEGIKDAATNPAVLGTAVGTAAQVAPLALTGADIAAPERPLVAPIPTRAHAGQTFSSVMQDAQHVPVNLTRTLAPLERAQQLSARGGGTVSTLDNLYKRVNTVNPIDYREARDWASNLSNLSGQDKLSASRPLQAELGKVSHAFNDDIADAAETVGRGEDYRNALKEYRRASQLREGLIKTGKVAAGAAGVGSAASIAKKLMP